MTEGTYPHGHGGVSVWCDQLVRGMADYEFDLVALVGTGTERPAWELPGNVASVISIPLWGNPPAGRALGRRDRDWLDTLLRGLFENLLGRAGRGAPGFGQILRALSGFAQRHDLSAALGEEFAVRALVDAWQEAGVAGEPTVYDAVTALQLLASSLRPLAGPPVRADVSHCVANGLAVLPALAAKWAFGTPILLTEHGIYLRERYLSYRREPYRWPVKALQLAFFRKLCSLAYAEADLIAPGNIYNKRWEERLGADPAVIRTVYNGVDPADFPAVEGEPVVPTVSWAGRIDPIKDLETLLRAFSLVHREIPQARLRMFGGASGAGKDYLERCKALAGELGIGEVATFEGRIPLIRDAYAAGHVVVLSSISEGFPYTVIEAMTSGRVCVATDVGGVAEAVGDTGMVVPPRDPAAMAAACVRLLSDRSLRHELGARARARALELFTVDRAIGTFDELYSSLAAGRPLLAEPEPTAERHSAPEPLAVGA